MEPTAAQRFAKTDVIRAGHSDLPLVASSQYALRLECTSPFRGATLVYERDATTTAVCKVPWDGGHVAVKVYKVEPEKGSGLSRPEVEVRYLQLFTDMVQKGISPHFTLLVGYLRTQQAPRSLGLPLAWPAGQDYMVIVAEWSDPGSFAHYLHTARPPAHVVRGLVFQVVAALALAVQAFPTFRHNDLHVSNVLLQALIGQKCVGYKVRDQKFVLPPEDAPCRVLLWDFFFASMSDADAGRRGVAEPVAPNKPRARNQYIDLHKFLDSLEYVLRRQKRLHLYPELKAFLDWAVPADFKHLTSANTKTRARREKHLEHLTPDTVLRHAYFDPYRRRRKRKCDVVYGW